MCRLHLEVQHRPWASHNSRSLQHLVRFKYHKCHSMTRRLVSMFILLLGAALLFFVQGKARRPQRPHLHHLSPRSNSSRQLCPQRRLWQQAWHQVSSSLLKHELVVHLLLLSTVCSSAGFGAFAGLGQPSPAAASSSPASPFGKGLSFGSSPAASGSPFSTTGVQPSLGSAGLPASFGQAAPVFGQPAASPASPTTGNLSGGFSTGFGQLGAFGQTSSFGQSGAGFGQPSPLGASFGQSSTPGGI